MKPQLSVSGEPVGVKLSLDSFVVVVVVVSSRLSKGSRVESMTIRRRHQKYVDLRNRSRRFAVKASPC